MVKIFRKQGWRINDSDKLVNGILKMIEKNGGKCPCTHNTEDYEGKDLHCPCTDYTIKDKCICKLYIQD